MSFWWKNKVINKAYNQMVNYNKLVSEEICSVPFIHQADGEKIFTLGLWE